MGNARRLTKEPVMDGQSTIAARRVLRKATPLLGGRAEPRMILRRARRTLETARPRYTVRQVGRGATEFPPGRGRTPGSPFCSGESPDPHPASDERHTSDS